MQIHPAINKLPRLTKDILLPIEKDIQDVIVLKLLLEVQKGTLKRIFNYSDLNIPPPIVSTQTLVSHL